MLEKIHESYETYCRNYAAACLLKDGKDIVQVRYGTALKEPVDERMAAFILEAQVRDPKDSKMVKIFRNVGSLLEQKGYTHQLIVGHKAACQPLKKEEKATVWERFWLPRALARAGLILAADRLPSYFTLREGQQMIRFVENAEELMNMSRVELSNGILSELLQATALVLPQEVSWEEFSGRTRLRGLYQGKVYHTDFFSGPEKVMQSFLAQITLGYQGKGMDSDREKEEEPRRLLILADRRDVYSLFLARMITEHLEEGQWDVSVWLKEKSEDREPDEFDEKLPSSVRLISKQGSMASGTREELCDLAFLAKYLLTTTEVSLGLESMPKSPLIRESRRCFGTAQFDLLIVVSGLGGLWYGICGQLNALMKKRVMSASTMESEVRSFEPPNLIWLNEQIFEEVFGVSERNALIWERLKPFDLLLPPANGMGRGVKLPSLEVASMPCIPVAVSDRPFGVKNVRLLPAPEKGFCCYTANYDLAELPLVFRWMKENENILVYLIGADPDYLSGYEGSDAVLERLRCIRHFVYEDLEELGDYLGEFDGCLITDRERMDAVRTVMQLRKKPIYLLTLDGDEIKEEALAEETSEADYQEIYQEKMKEWIEALERTV